MEIKPGLGMQGLSFSMALLDTCDHELLYKSDGSRMVLEYVPTPKMVSVF